MVFIVGKVRWCSALFTGLLITLTLVGRAAAGDPSTAGADAVPDQGEADVEVVGGEPSPSAPQGDAHLDADPAAVEEFRPVLEPYGVWVEDPTYGLVWVPNAEVVGPDFTPYVTAGHWELTAEGDWLWVSEYDWGWVPFHYGRWVWIPGRGWAWVAGRSYAPAWVVWRVGEPGYAYVGWAPMPPDYYWYGGVAVAVWLSPPPYYVYCHSHYVFVPHVHRHVVSGNRAHGIAGRTRPYHPAAPRPGRHAAAPRWKGPSPAEAGVPQQAVPRTAAKPDPRALAAARSTNAGASRARSTPQGRSGVGAPVYRGASAGTLPVERRARPLASDPRGRSSSQFLGNPRRGGSTTVPPAYRGEPGRSLGAGSAGLPRARSPEPTPGLPERASPPTYRGNQARPTYQQPSLRPTYRQPSPSPTYRRPTPSPTYREPAARPTYRQPSPRPVFRSPSSGSTYRQPSSSPVFRSAPQGSSGGNQGKRDRGKGRATGRRGGRHR